MVVRWFACFYNGFQNVKDPDWHSGSLQPQHYGRDSLNKRGVDCGGFSTPNRSDCKDHKDPRTGQPLNFNFLPMFASENMGVNLSKPRRKNQGSPDLKVVSEKCQNLITKQTLFSLIFSYFFQKFSFLLLNILVFKKIRPSGEKQRKNVKEESSYQYQKFVS